MGPLTPIIGLRLLALAAGLRHKAEIGQPGLCFSAYGHKFGINHLAARLARMADRPSPGDRRSSLEAPMDEALESRTRELAEELWRVEPGAWRRPLVAVGRRMLGGLDDRPALRSALFRFVDVAPACRGPGDRGSHLRAFVREVDGDRVPMTLRPLRGRLAAAPLLAAYGL